MEKTLAVIEVPADGKSNWIEGSYCIFFVYSKYNGNFIIKGFRREAEKYLKEHFTHYFYYCSMWNNKTPRGHWIFWKRHIHITAPSKRNHKDRKYSVTDWKKIDIKYKRLPKRWIKDFDEL